MASPYKTWAIEDLRRWLKHYVDHNEGCEFDLKDAAILREYLKRTKGLENVRS